MHKQFNWRHLQLPPDDIFNCDLDVLVQIEGDAEYVVSFMTIEKVISIFHKCFQTGEYLSGTYLALSDVIMVRNVSDQEIQRTLEHLISEGDLEIFTRSDP